MADGNSGGVGILGVLVGAAIVIGIGFFLFKSGMIGGKPAGPSITITAPSGK